MIPLAILGVLACQSKLPPRFVPATAEQIQKAIPSDLRIAPESRPTNASLFGELEPIWKPFYTSEKLDEIRKRFEQGAICFPDTYDTPSIAWPSERPELPSPDDVLVRRIIRTVAESSPEAKFHASLDQVAWWNGSYAGAASTVREFLFDFNPNQEVLKQILAAMPEAPYIDTNLQFALRVNLYKRIEELKDPATFRAQRQISDLAAEGNIEVLPTVTLFSKVAEQQVRNCSLPITHLDHTAKEEIDKLSAQCADVRTVRPGLDEYMIPRSKDQIANEVATKEALRKSMRARPNSLGLALAREYALPWPDPQYEANHMYAAARHPRERYTRPEAMIVGSFRCRNEWNLTRVMVASYIYRQRHHSFPATLQELVSEKLIRKIPEYAYNGDPLRYKPQWCTYGSDPRPRLVMGAFWFQESPRWPQTIRSAIGD